MRNLLFKLLVFSAFISINLQAQQLVKLNSKIIDQVDSSDFFWFYEQNGNQFAAVIDLAVLNSKNINYQILDDDIETGKYYWVNTRFNLFLNKTDLIQNENSTILWNDYQSALVMVKNIRDYSQFLSREYHLQKINFRANTQSQKIRSYPNAELTYNNTIQTVVDSVNLSELYLTEEHLTGLRSFWLDGQKDSIQSRYSYSPQIFKAQAYIESRFQDYGYNVEYLPFSLGTFQDIQFDSAAPDYGWLVTNDKVFGTQDNGLSWNIQYEGTTGGDIWSVFAYDQNTAYAVGDYGVILKTSDGTTWQQLNATTNAFLFGIQFRTNTLGWICGDSGLLLKTTNGGTNWSTKSTPTSSRLYDLFFVNDSTGWAVGRDGVIIHTNNYGETWTLQSTPTSNRLYGVHFIDENNGFVVGWNGLLRTTNGGTTWTSVSVPSSSYLYDIDFVDSNTGMIVGWSGTCLTTTNGGSTWTSAGNIYQQDMYGFDLINSTDAWAGGTGMVASSADFGSNWTARLDSIPTGSLMNVIATKTGTQFPDQYYIICAHYDAITYTTPMTLAPGADDNGSGTAAVIEAARVFKDYDFNYSIKFILFPGEEQGLWGSEAYATYAASIGQQILGVLNMDMIGYDSNGDGIIEIHAGTMSSSQAIGTQMVSNINTFGLSLTAQYQTSGSSSASDHASFWNHGYPAIMHIEDFQDFTPHYHSNGDVLSTMNLPYFHDNAKLTIGTLAQLAILDTTSVVSIPDMQTIADNFILYDPYPNPFNPVVNIKYSINSPEKVSVDVYNILGEHIQSLVNNYQQAGDYHLAWNTQNESSKKVASGVYLIRTTFGKKSFTKKVILMR